ncbi:hypothetical protein [Clostridium sp. M14]|uniref:hypothetical protein n=1 Tax=Clostridium sp. M14 TaxID=2716311 RepID=UPI0013EE5F92|nr:hypothetical protein [Clostridium sp. M14]MBZ9693222.1 hypothetical protein [Clostridium sp. M14]
MRIKNNGIKPEIEKLKKELEVKDRVISEYDDIFKSLNRTVESNQKWIERLKDGF